jgi:hypothetical protein
MDNDLFERPIWMPWLSIITITSILVSFTCLAVLAIGVLPALRGLAIVGGMAPVIPLIMVLPVLSNEMRLVDSIRADLLKIPGKD